MKGKITAIFTDSARIKAEIETLQPSSFEQIIENLELPQQQPDQQT